MKALAAAIAVLAMVLASGCGSQSSSDTGGASSAPAAAPTTSSTMGAQQHTTTRATVTTPRCVARVLSVSFLGQQGATGHGVLGFALRNSSSRSCHTLGFPGVLFLGRAGRPLATHAIWTTHDYFGTAPEVRLLLAPGGSASFRVGVTHGVTLHAKCATAYGLQVIPPDDTATLRVRIPGGAYECRTATVSPLRPGTSAYQ
jgi:hypothetical protein